jgi:hypothetical protein
MTLREKLLYHHAHPVKLAADVSAGALAAWLLWNQHLLRAGAIGLGLPALASLFVLQFADFERLKRSPLGRYVGTHMSLPLQVTAVVGVIIFAGAAWYRSIFYCVVGLAVVAFVWTRGLWRSSTRAGGAR